MPATARFSTEEIMTQLERVVSSSGFRRSGRIARFFRFVVQQTLSGKGHELKEYVIAIEVFDKDWTFDPGLNPIVRVEARRLRYKLQAYYAGAGSADPIKIELRPGSYVPSFRGRAEDNGLRPAHYWGRGTELALSADAA